MEFCLELLSRIIDYLKRPLNSLFMKILDIERYDGEESVTVFEF